MQLQDPISEDPANAQLSHRVLKKTTIPAKYIENIIDLQLKVDILETILKEESSAHGEIEEKALCLSRDLKSTEEKYLLLTNKYNGLNNEIEEAKSVIEALETQQVMSINELEDLRNCSNRYAQE
nr:kinesin-like protein KIN-12D [Tanacetum cinerariifolium]